MKVPRSRPPGAEVPAAALAGVALVALLSAAAIGVLSQEGGLRIGIAQSGEGPAIPSEGAAFVAVLPDGSLLVDGEPLALSALPARIAREGPPGLVVVGATEETSYEAVVAVLDALASLRPAAGVATRVLLPTRAEITDQAKRIGRDPFAPRAPRR